MKLKGVIVSAISVAETMMGRWAALISLSLLNICESLGDQETDKVQTICICMMRHVSSHLQYPGALQALTLPNKTMAGDTSMHT